jgi:ATP-dependent DNA ligase
VASGYLTDMLVVRADGFVDPCIPSRAPKPPSGPDWVHEIKHDGYRLIVRRDGEAVRLFTRRGYDWTDRYPAIAAAAAKLRAKSFTLDGEAVVAGADGVAMFDALHRRGRVSDAILQACWNSTARTCARCRSASASLAWRGCWLACRSG